VSPRYVTGYFPIGLAYVSSYIRQFGHQVTALNLHHHRVEDGDGPVLQALREVDYDVVGITGITVAFRELERLVPVLRKHTNAKIVLGGGITSCESELVMRTIRPDFMVLGEGELIFTSLLERLVTGRDGSDVEGLWYWDGDVPRTTGEGPSIPNLDDLPFPDLEQFGIIKDMHAPRTMKVAYHETRFDYGRTLPVTASRSCPFRCTFCYHAGMGKYRRHSMVRVVDHIEDMLPKTGADHVMIYDELFSANTDRIFEFCDLLEERKLKFTWFCQLRVDRLSQDLLTRMRQSGCRHISYGFESGSDVILESMDKKVTAAQISRATKMTREARIGIQANFLFGDPAETDATLHETLAFQRENDLMFVDWSAVIPYPGTRLYNGALDRGLITDRLAFMRSICDISRYLWKDMVNLTEMSDEEFRERYIMLRELNDQNHRTRPTQVNEAKVLGPTLSEFELECRHCHRIERRALPYPPEAAHGPVDAASTTFLMGYNIVCDGCNRKSHLAANRFPHIERIYTMFQAGIDRLRRSGEQVVLLPALDRYAGVFREDIDISGLNLVAVLDSRQYRWGATFEGLTVEPMTPERLRELGKANFVVLPWVEYRRALATLAEAGISERSILCWNELFAESLDSRQQCA